MLILPGKLTGARPEERELGRYRQRELIIDFTGEGYCEVWQLVGREKSVTPPAQNVSQSSPWSCQACSVEDQQPASYGPRWARQILVIITAKWPSGELARGKDWGVDPPPHAARVLLASHALSKAEVEDET